MREAGAYRDSRLCVKNSTSEILDIGPGRNTVGYFASLRPGQRQCFESNDTAEALANATILFGDDSFVVAAAENFLIWDPEFKICYTRPRDQCTYDSVAPQYRIKLDVGKSADPVTLNGHSYKASRLADDTYWIVYEVDVLS